MPVTEFALLHLTTTPPPAESLPPNPKNPILPTLASAMHIQSTWHATAFPALPSSAADRAAVWFAQVEDPSWLLTTARWASVDAHWDWIRSAENAGVMTGLEEGGYIVGGDTVLWHVGGEIFGGGGGSLLESPVVSVTRMFVARGDRGRFAGKFGEVRGVLEGYAGPNLVRFGWREDGEEGAEEDEFVLVCGWESVEQHFGFAEAEGFGRYGELRELIARTDLKHYKRLLLE
ncbi:hypothetical protein C8A01DRAFT_43603 [Parachaetomium inaequale]|uniref:ABM domain-containing protein n=1 Tax=Parachaetomium inaequale TaxID=2588326 RepID=A0AAN6SUV8_9PEZI|nr:hypothetical protein C8A01DRAFT_43603 [Parachaetomium inaequale]